MRNSRQKFIVAKALSELYTEHPTAAEVYDKARQMDPRISLATVYRGLKSLVDAGEVKKVTVPDAADRFDPQTHEHHHVSCVNCQKFFDVDIALVKKLRGKITSDTGVALDSLQLIGTGHCQQCIKNKKEGICRS